MRGSAFTLLFAAFLVAGVQGHGWLSYPESRNSRANALPTTPAGIAYNRNAGNGRAEYNLECGSCQPARMNQPGVCGDPFQTVTNPSLGSYFANMAPMAATTFSAGQRVRFSWTITTNHGGFFGFKICPQRTGLTQACFDANVLQRADGLGTRTYILSRQYSGPFQRQGIDPDFVYFTPEYIIPSNINCAGGCVLQSEYHSLNSCSTPCENTAQCIGNGLDYNGLRNPVLNQFNMPACSMGPDFGNGERFHNCADIIITGSNGGGPTPPGPTPPSPPPPSGCRAFAPSGGACSASVCCPNRDCGGAPPASPPPPQPPVCSRTAAPGGACGASAGGTCCPSGQW
ncbi:hypothetical protein OEZ85_004142 [Tetradesmus obliquus]|uniref:Chitin-binding type-4 domain-containing protein n=1 Tax=Tetradesmus obliquus TaxID=3088 RepID=A0ABY8UIT6_TETOB|nr:hypothetical protein OEZ85_004142 [Tetradesmus obliquus]